MPIGFGPGVGPRQNPHGAAFDSSDLHTTTLSVTCYVDQAAVQAFLPNGLMASADRLTLSFSTLRNIAWLAGRDYNIVSVTSPATIRTDSQSSGDCPDPEGSIDGDFVHVLWENRADPIITGREELGFAKLYADIDDVAAPSDGALSASAQWDGFTFAQIAADDLTQSPTSLPSRPRLHFKYLPRTGDWGIPDVAYPVITPADNPSLRLQSSWSGTGRFSFRRATFEQLPTLCHIVNTLADLELGETVSASLVITTGGKDLSDQRAVHRR